MTHLSGSFVVASRPLAVSLRGAVTIPVGAWFLTGFTSELESLHGADAATVALDTLTVAAGADAGPNRFVIDGGSLSVCGSAMNTLAIYHLRGEDGSFLAFNDLFLARRLLEAAGLPAEYDAEAVASGGAPYAPLARVAAGERLEISAADLSLRRTFAPTPLESGGPPSPDLKAAQRALFEALDAAVGASLVPGEPVVHLALSGGIDSGTIAALARRRGARVQAWTVRTDWGDEVREATETARFLDVPIEVVSVSTEDILAEVPSVVRYFFFAQPESVEIALVASTLYRTLQTRDPSPRHFLTGYGSDLLNGGGVYEVPDEQTLEARIAADVARTLGSNEFGNLAAHRYGVRASHPFWDDAVIRTALRTPGRFKLIGGEDKHFLREMMRGLLPDATVRRRKLAAHQGTGLAARLCTALVPQGADDGKLAYRRALLSLHRGIFHDGLFE